MRLFSGPSESKMGIYDISLIKEFIEANPDFQVDVTEEEIDEMLGDDDPDDDVIQNCWFLLIYIKVVGEIKFRSVRDKILEFYSLEEGEYDPAKCYPIHDLFTESGNSFASH